jgi:hypothetical protein
MTLQGAEHGDLRAIEGVLAQLATQPGPESRAWTLALETVRWSYQPSRRSAPELHAARAIAAHAPQVARIVAQVCAVMERVAFCTFDSTLLAGWIDLHAGLARDTETRAADDVSLPVARLWQRLLSGELAGMNAAARELGEEASRRGAAAAVIETAVMRALVALSAGALDEALDLGRRASRMAQAEALSHHEYLANIALARVRRYSGRPHLALHILGALGRAAPSTWSGWIGWETLLAGGPRVPSAAYDGPSAAAERRLHQVLEAARAADRAAFDRAAGEAERATRAWPVIGEEVAALIAAVDPTRESAPDAMAAWIRGSTASVPFGLHGIGARNDAEPQAESPTAYVIARPGENGRRFLLPGLALAPPARMLSRGAGSSGARTETGVAALALAGEAGDSRDGFFRSVYGFTFVPSRHRSVLDTLCHRMRALLGSAGEVRRNEADAGAPIETASEKAASAATSPVSPTIAMALRESVVVPDMRCALPTADRVLRALALLGTTSASDAAQSLRMPLRTVQAVLQQLVAEGACSTERDGRRVAYRIEDTTFTAVTSA